jgi:phage gp46-like protein
MDFATILSPNGYFDWAIIGGDLASDDGLDTKVAISLWTDRLANVDDVIPDGSGDRRGWWGDAYLPPLPSGKPDHIGSRLWLLGRALQIPETAQRAQAYCQEALQWLLDDDVASAVSTPLPTFPALGMMRIVNTIAQQTAAGATVNRRYTSLWDMTRGTLSFSGVVIGGF